MIGGTKGLGGYHLECKQSRKISRPTKKLDVKDRIPRPTGNSIKWGCGVRGNGTGSGGIAG